MRWDDLFSDLEGEWAQAQAGEFEGEVRDRTRREDALLRLPDRLRPSVGSPLTVTCLGAGLLRGRLLDTGPDWLLLEEGDGRELLVALVAVAGVTGLVRQTGAPGQEGEVGRRLDLRWALRGLARARAGVQLLLHDGAVVAGTVDRVGADHLDLAEHPVAEPRRASAVRAVRLVPLTALSAVRSR